MKSTESRCVICSNPIDVNAQKCIHCNEYQTTWQRILSKLQLQSLIALIPILTLAYTVIAGMVVESKSNLKFSVIKCAAANVHVFVSNVGNSSAIIKSAKYQSLNREAIPFELELESNELIIEQGETKSINLRVPKKAHGGLAPPGLRAKYTKECLVTITLDTIAFDHKPTPMVMTCACPS